MVILFILSLVLGIFLITLSVKLVTEFSLDHNDKWWGGFPLAMAINIPLVIVPIYFLTMCT